MLSVVLQFIAGIGFLLIVVLIVLHEDRSDWSWLGTYITCGFLFFSVLFFIDSFKDYKEIILKENAVIPAIEVYRGNTDLIISYRDTIPVDSTVVLKKGE